MMSRPHADFTNLAAGILAILFFCAIPTVFWAIATESARKAAQPVQTCVDESGHFERECP